MSYKDKDGKWLNPSEVEKNSEGKYLKRYLTRQK